MRPSTNTNIRIFFSTQFHFYLSALPTPTLPTPTLPIPTLPSPTLPSPTLPTPTLPTPTLSEPTRTIGCTTAHLSWSTTVVHLWEDVSGVRKAVGTTASVVTATVAPRADDSSRVRCAALAAGPRHIEYLLCSLFL